MRTLAILVLAALLVTTARSGHAQDNRYSTWADPNAQNDVAATDAEARLKDLIARLNKMIDAAEKSRAADPTFLRDLRALANVAASPWNTVVLDDAFADGDFTQNPSWQVLSGDYFIEQGWGLRNRILSNADQVQPSSSDSNNSGEDLAKVLLGNILRRATGVENQTGPVENMIVTRVPISNAFRLSAEISSWVENGHLEIGVFQGGAARIGYRLLYVGGKGLQLHRVGNSGSSVIESATKALTLEDKKYHAIVWSRGTDGKMTVTVDGETVISTVDRGFSDPFDGVRISNKTGDFIIKRITATGV